MAQIKPYRSILRSPSPDLFQVMSPIRLDQFRSDQWPRIAPDLPLEEEENVPTVNGNPDTQDNDATLREDHNEDTSDSPVNQDQAQPPAPSQQPPLRSPQRSPTYSVSPHNTPPPQNQPQDETINNQYPPTFDTLSIYQQYLYDLVREHGIALQRWNQTPSEQERNSMLPAIDHLQTRIMATADILRSYTPPTPRTLPPELQEYSRLAQISLNRM